MCDLETLVHRWLFWLRAKSRHGIHSPFIYRFLDEGLYRRDLRHLHPDQRLLLAALDHFGPVRLGAAPPEGRLATWLATQRPDRPGGQPPFDLFIFESPTHGLVGALDRPGWWHNDTVVFVGNLRSHKGSRQKWLEAARKAPVTVVLETCTSGLLFFRRQQARQHFRIRN